MDAGVAIEKILAPIDRSKYKEKIMAYAISLGKAWGAEITAIHVIDPGHGIPGGRVKEKELEREKKKQKDQLKIYSTKLIFRQRRKELI
jgi:nucleotide-binding universal stress UspA family protein